MGGTKRFGKEYREEVGAKVPAEICPLCGERLEVDAESGEAYCPVCEESPEG